MLDETILLEDLEISLDRKQIRRYLRHGQNEGLKRQVESKVREAKTQLNPKCIYKIKEITPALKEEYNLPGPVREAAFVALAVSTIGSKLEQRVDQLMKDKKYSESVILDALGSAAISELSHKSAYKIYDEAKSNGLGTTRVFEPGGGMAHWPVENQAFIFENLEADKIGVKLTTSFTMLPKKSVSFVMGLGNNIKQTKDLFSCEGCPRTDCTYRYIPEG